MASRLKLQKAAGYLAAFCALCGLALTRLWAVLGGRLPGKVIGVAALVLAAVCVVLVWRLELPRRLLAPFTHPAANLLVFSPFFLLGCRFDLSYEMFDAAGLLVDGRLFHVLSGLGSGLVLGCTALALCTAGRGVKGLGRVDWRLMLGLFAALNLITAFYAFGVRTVYVWDNAGYWTVARTLAAEQLGFDQLYRVAATTLTEDYNHLLAWPISLVMRLFGGSRAVFLFAISNLYTLPGLWGLAVLGRGKKGGGLLLAVGLPMLVYTGLVGFVDVAACSLAIWAFVVWSHKEADALCRGVLTGALLVGTFLLRRYFFFFALSFGVGALVENLIADRKKWVGFAALFSSCGVFTLFFAQSFLVEKILGTNYGDLYSAYALGLRSDLMLFCRYFGLVLLLALGALAVVALVRRKESRGEVAMALVQGLVCFFLLTRVQSHGQQHLLLYLPAVAALAAVAYRELAAEGWRLWLARVLALACLVPTLLPTPQPASVDEISFPAPAPSFTFWPPERADMDELVALADFVDGLSVEGQVSAAVVASSFLLNSDTLLNLRPSLSLPAPDRTTRLIYMSSVDKRDGFSWNVLEADYLVVGDPVQVHLGEENQRVVTILARGVLDGVGVGTAYEALDETFTLADGSVVRIFRRVREVTQAEREDISRQLIEAYPDYGWLYQVP